ncbi:metallophosphoesterase family protein [Consotaella aegiceratis]|uniref:metallophosphoesterase family protein n=1 Tax=Consotaella aegiceratis TaxID=3097961 RepID=UPI002F413CF5
MTEFDTTRFAAIADIHGNADALAAVLDDIVRVGIRDIVNLGDHFSGPLAADQTADLILARDMISIRGNHDRWLLDRRLEDMGPSDRAARGQLSDAHMGWLRGLPSSQTIGDAIFLCHGTPRSDTTYWLEQVLPDGQVVARGREAIEAEAAGIGASLILCAHTHLPRRVELADGRLVVNPGSVGCPAYDDDLPVYHLMQSGTAAACYAVFEKAGDGWLTSFRHVPYDTTRMAALAEAAGRPEWARAVATGWVR